MCRQFRFIEDPGHGWLEIFPADSRAVGIDPEQYSPFSYYKDFEDGTRRLYLEEDIDAGLFVEAWEAKHGKTIKGHLLRVYEEDTPIRNYPGLSGSLYVSPFANHGGK